MTESERNEQLKEQQEQQNGTQKTPKVFRPRPGIKIEKWSSVAERLSNRLDLSLTDCINLLKNQ